MRLISRKTLRTSMVVYDLEIRENHNYHVTKSDIPVHNSGKGFVKDKLLGVEGYSFDVDELKALATRSTAINNRVKKELGLDLSKYNTRENQMALKDPEVVKELHAIVGDYLKLDDRRKQAVFGSVLAADPERKPNLIFDVTMKSMKHFDKYTAPLISRGYKPENIHIVWVMNKIDVALQQNRDRPRTVPEEILLATHEGAAYTMRQIMQLGDKLKSSVNGDIVIAFNQVKVDSEFVSGPEDRPGRTKKSGYFKDANYVYVKRKGRPVKPDALNRDILSKIASYVPRSVKKAFEN